MGPAAIHVNTVRIGSQINRLVESGERLLIVAAQHGDITADFPSSCIARSKPKCPLNVFFGQCQIGLTCPSLIQLGTRQSPLGERIHIVRVTIKPGGVSGDFAAKTRVADGRIRALRRCTRRLAALFAARWLKRRTSRAKRTRRCFRHRQRQHLAAHSKAILDRDETWRLRIDQLAAKPWLIAVDNSRARHREPAHYNLRQIAI